jgi:dipeptidyl aminopeptidase/acylaminoacyl peptidase
VLAAETAPAVAVESFFKHAAYSSFRLSPSGRYVAGIVPVNDRKGLVVIDLDTRKPEEPTTVRSSDIGWFEWVSDERLVFTVMDTQVGLGEQRGSGLFTVKRDRSGFRVLARPPTIAGQMVYRYTRFLARLNDDSSDILVVANDSHERYPDVYRMDTETGRKTLKSLDKPGDVVTWVADRNGEVRAAVAEEKDGSQQVYWRSSATAKWESLGHYKLRDHSMVPVGFDGDGSLIVASNIGRDTYALHRYDPPTKALSEPLAAHPKLDLDGGLVYDRRKKQIVGVRYDADKPGVAWFDDEWARLAAAVDKLLPNRFNALQRAESGTRVLVFSSSDVDPGTYHALDLERRRMEELVRVRPEIDPQSMPTRQPVVYTARDGLDIPAFLTLPKLGGARNLPLVLYVHGGPWIPGAGWTWRDEPAYLASLGYAVLEPAFRGSTSLGKKHFEASFKQWGRAMQDDLNDGVDWLVAKGTVDPKRVCIVGASYGGYAVMMGLARDPERWKCGVNYVGVTDINLMYDVAWSDLSDSTFIRYSAKEMLGDPSADAAQLKATSPLEQAARIKAPVLMAYGGRDLRVPLVHGTAMRDALQRHNVPVEWVVYGDEGHGFLLEANRFDFYRRVAAFLDRHIGK